MITVNITKAKEVTKERLRAEREPLFAAQDVLFQRAQETGADTTAIVAEKARLRNITNLVDTCTTTAELSELNVQNNSIPEPQMPPADSVTFETIELDANKEHLLLKVACGQTGAPVLINVDDAYGNNQQAEGVLDATGSFGFLAAMSEMQDGPLDLTAVVWGKQGDIQAQATFELTRGA
jgi:hypothetical protein